MLASTLASGRKRKLAFDDAEEDEKSMDERWRSKDKYATIKVQGGQVPSQAQQNLELMKIKIENNWEEERLRLFKR